MTFKPQLFVLLLLVSLTSANVQGATVTFDFLGTAGADLDGTSMGTTSVTVDGITLNLTAISQVDGFTADEFNQTASGGGNFGINAPGSADSTDALDGAEGIESILFSVTSSVPLSSLTLDTFDFDRITNAGGDAGQLSFAGGGSTISFTNATVATGDVLTVNESITTGQTFTLAFVDGNGFGLEFLTFTATAVAVPEPSSLGFLLLAATGLFVRRR